MSVCGQTEEDSGSEEAGAPVREMYEQKAVSTVVRVLTVLAYLLSVSLAAILLSVYYVCVWQSPKLPPVNHTGEGYHALRALRAPPHHHHNDTTPYNHTRRSNITVSDVVTSPPVDLTSLPADSSEPPDPPTPPDLTSTPPMDDNVTWIMPNDTTPNSTVQR